MTLRELQWAANAKERAEWTRTVAVVQWISGSLTGKPPEAEKITPAGLFTQTTTEAGQEIDPELRSATEAQKWDFLEQGLMTVKGKTNGK